MRLFWLKKVLGNHFTLLCLFGKHGKFDQMEINFRVDRKITLIACKTILGFILPENHLHLSHTLSSFSHEHSKLSEDQALQRHTNAGHRPTTQFVLLRRPIVCWSTHIEFDPPSISLQQPHLTSDPPSTQSDLVTSPPIHTPPTHPLWKLIHPQSFPQSLNLSLFDLWFCCCCCGGVGGGVLVVFLLCGGGFVWIVVDFFGWWWILWYKICLEVEKMWKICRKIAFSECYQTLKIVF